MRNMLFLVFLQARNPATAEKAALQQKWKKKREEKKLLLFSNTEFCISVLDLQSMLLRGAGVTQC